MFGAISFRIHPTFTQIKEWSRAGKKPDGIEAIIEFDDQFGEPTAPPDAIRLELYNFQESDPDHRGHRLAIWSATLSDHDDQVGHWDPAARGYTFQLAFPQFAPTTLRSDRSIRSQQHPALRSAYSRTVGEGGLSRRSPGQTRPSNAPNSGIFSEYGRNNFLVSRNARRSDSASSEHESPSLTEASLRSSRLTNSRIAEVAFDGIFLSYVDCPH